MSKARIMVVEDDRLTAKKIQTDLEDLGYSITTVASSGEGAIKEVEVESPDLVLMDIELAGKMDGIEAAENIRSVHNVHVIYITSHADEGLLERAKVTGPLGYLIKPIEKKALHAAIEVALYRKKMEEALERSNREQIEANLLKDLFIDIMHHDIMNPAAVIKGAIQLMMADADRTDRDNLDLILRNVNKQIDMVKKASVLSRLRSSDELEIQGLDLKEIIENALQDAGPIFDDAGMVVENLVDINMPIKANPILGDAILNFLSNAVKYAPMGKKILITAITKDSHYTLSVKDYGPGIPDTDKLDIFERFVRRNKLGVKGSGLGLAIAKRVVDLHGGDIWVEDNPEGGSIFCIRLPKGGN